MALDKQILGAAIYAVRKVFSGQTAAQLIAQYGSLETAQLKMAEAEAEAIILHIQTAGEVKTAGTALAQIGKLT